MSVNIRLKHSSVPGKAPLPSDLLDGELALNINTASPAAYFKDSAGNVVKLAGVGAIGGYWNRTGTVLSPTNVGDDITTTGDVNGAAGTFTGNVTVAQLASTVGIGNVAVDANGTLVRQALPFSWDANDDTYSRIPVADRSILVQARMKRCLVTDAGVISDDVSSIESSEARSQSRYNTQCVVNRLASCHSCHRSFDAFIQHTFSSTSCPTHCPLGRVSEVSTV